MIFMEIESGIIAHAPFCVPRFHDFQNGAYAMISLLSSMKINLLQKSEFSITPRRVSGGQPAAWIPEQCMLIHFLRCKKVCQNDFPAPPGTQNSHFDTLLHLKIMSKCISGNHAAD